MNFWKDLWEDFLLPVGLFLFVVALVLAVILAFCFWYDWAACSNLQEVTGRHTEWRFAGGCYVEHEDEMLPYERWKLLEIRIKE